MPNEFQEVEWIQGGTTQYINTEYYCSSDTKLEIGYSRTNQNNAAIIGALDNNIGIKIQTWWDRIRFYFGDYYSNPRLLIYYDGNEHAYLLEDKTLWLDDNLIGTTTTTFSQITKPLYLFASNNNGTKGDNGASGTPRVFYLKIYDNGNLERDMVPCYRVADNEIGMYDLVYKEFYTNQGTGTFTKGPEVWN